MGFFTSSELSKKAEKKVDVNQLEAECDKCGLYKTCDSPRMKVSGEGRKKILVISEAPGPEEDPKTAEELVALEMPKITEALELNDFEQAVVSSVLTKYTQKRIELQLLKLPKDDAMAAYEELAAAQKEELQQGLPPEKFEAFMELAEDGFNSKKARKKKKQKKKKT